MARPTSTKLTYFPHDCSMRHDKALHFLCAKYKSPAPYALYNIILETIFGSSEGYFLPWNEREIVLLSDRLYMSVEDTSRVLNDAISNQLFNEEISKNYEVLTSKEIQRRYLRMCEQRKKLVFVREYLLIDLKSEITSKGNYKSKSTVDKILSTIRIISINDQHINATLEPEKNNDGVISKITPVNSEITSDNSEISTQSKSKSKSKREIITTTYSAIFDHENFDEIFPAYQKFIMVNEIDHAKEIENLKVRLGGEKNPEKYNAITDCLNYIRGLHHPAGESVKMASTIEELKERLISRMWQDAVCMTHQFDPQKFMEYTLDWILLRESADTWHYPINHMKQYLIEAYKKEIKNGTRKNNGSNSNQNYSGNAQSRSAGFRQEKF